MHQRLAVGPRSKCRGEWSSVRRGSDKSTLTSWKPRMRRPTNALVLASINGQVPLIRRLRSREREKLRDSTGLVSLVAGDRAILRRVLASPGTPIRAGDGLALLGDEGEMPEGVRRSM